MTDGQNTKPEKPEVSFGVLEGQPTARGLIVKKLDPASSLGKGGVLAGDELLDVSGHELQDPKTLLAELEKIGAGNSISVRLVRDGAELVLEMKLRPKKAFDYQLDAVDGARTRKVSPAA
jgi:S1-C subfamily serine protease